MRAKLPFSIVFFNLFYTKYSFIFVFQVKLQYDPLNSETIVALSTPDGQGAISVIRLSGKNAFKTVSPFLYNKHSVQVDFHKFKTHSAHFCQFKVNEVLLDELVVTVFKGPNSYTGEDTIEISCHGSQYIQQQIIHNLIRNGARLANPGEFTFRAFFNNKLDLIQAEAVADLIASNSATSHQVAIHQMRGGFSDKIKALRENLLNFASLIELELDFSEEDVEFANRNDLIQLINTVLKVVSRLIGSFELGNVIKNGIPVVIAGRPNAGKSTLLNLLLEEERAIVSEIPGTTRDSIEETVSIKGVLFRFIDTAGIRATDDFVEQLGVSRTFEKIQKSSIVVYLFDIHELTPNALKAELNEIAEHLNESAQLIVVGNKIDKEDRGYTEKEFGNFPDILFISSKEKYNIDALHNRFIELFDKRAVNASETIVTNIRHVQALQNAEECLKKVLDGLKENKSGELISIDLRNVLYHLGLIAGAVSNEDLLTNIFSRFCIGK